MNGKEKTAERKRRKRNYLTVVSKDENPVSHEARNQINIYQPETRNDLILHSPIRE